MMMGTRASAILVGAEIEENLALRYLGACLKAGGHDAFIAPCLGRDDFPRVIKHIRRKTPDIVAISMPFQMQALMHLTLAEQIKREGYRGHIIVGGHFPTFEYKRILESYPAVDSVGRYEGEATIVALADALVAGNGLDAVPNLVYRNGAGLRENACIDKFPDLDALPFPMRSARMQQRLGENFATLVSSRGCWHSSCLYCCIGAFHRLKQERFAMRSAGNVAREIADLVERRRVRVFQFHDDNFMPASKAQTLARLNDLGEALKSAGVDTDNVAFYIKARPDILDDEVGDALKALGCAGVFLGIENASESGLASLIRAATVEHLERAIETLRSRRIAITCNLLVFHPKAKPHEYRKNIEFVKSHLFLPFDFGRAEIVAGSPLDRMAHALQLRRGSWPWWDYELLDPEMNRILSAFRHAFRHPGSFCTAAVHAVMTLAYHAGFACRRYPGQTAEALARQTDEIIKSWNTFFAASLERVPEIAAMKDPAEAIEALRIEVDTRAKSVFKAVTDAQRPMLKYQRMRGIFSRFGVEDAFESNAVLRKLLKC